MDLNVFVLDG